MPAALPVPVRCRRPMLIRLAALALAVIALGLMPARAADPDALWKIVSGQCVPNQQQHRNAAPCAEVDLTGGVERGHVVLKDLVGNTQFLVIPTARVTGIEDPALLAANAPNYWAPAWGARFYVFARAHQELPRDAIGLAVNSMQGRSQNQLHIHVDCVRPDLRRYLLRHARRIGPRWGDLGEAVNGHRYLAMRVPNRDLAGLDPFEVLARNIPAARQHMGNWTLVVVGLPRGFVLLAGHVNPATNDPGSGEELLDHDCALAKMR
ncbi:MAG TPA: CDP-diacylglycerol diphosphatase [Xanthobacteraceae bacterium]|nr:CDP-diacylglycerol diphosphatase [Xanthobacteraceae bacterium]